MHYHFVPMNESYARTMIEQWQYGGEYAIHDYANEADHLLDPEGWGKELFAVLNESDKLVGELTIQFFDEQDVFIEYDNFDQETLGAAEMWLGFGLKPSLTGRGLGEGFVFACLEFAVQHYAYSGDTVSLGVPAFNKRAIKVYERVGFVVFNRVVSDEASNTFEAIQMKKVLKTSVE